MMRELNIENRNSNLSTNNKKSSNEVKLNLSKLKDEIPKNNNITFSNGSDNKKYAKFVTKKKNKVKNEEKTRNLNNFQIENKDLNYKLNMNISNKLTPNNLNNKTNNNFTESTKQNTYVNLGRSESNCNSNNNLGLNNKINKSSNSFFNDINVTNFNPNNSNNNKLKTNTENYNIDSNIYVNTNNFVQVHQLGVTQKKQYSDVSKANFFAFRSLLAC